MATITPGFKKSAERVEALPVITSTNATSLRKRAYQEVNAPNADLAAARAYGDVFDQLAGHKTDKPTTKKYLANAAVEFKNHQRINEALPVVEKALRQAASKSDDWKDVIDFSRKIQTRSSFGSPNTPVGFIVAIHLKNTSRAPEYYAEKFAELLRSEPSLAPYRDLINTLVVLGYDSFKLPTELGKNDLKPAPVEGSLTLRGASKAMSKVLKDVERRGRVLQSEADALFYPPYFKRFEVFPNLDAVDKYQEGLERLVPFADHKVTRSVLQEAIQEIAVIRQALTATNAVTELLADPKKSRAFAKLIDPDRPPEPLSSGVRVWVKSGTTDWRKREELGKDILALAKSLPGFPDGLTRVDVQD